jgi:hypothetical protein
MLCSQVLKLGQILKNMDESLIKMVNNLNAVIKRTITGIISFRNSKLQNCSRQWSSHSTCNLLYSLPKKLKAYLQIYFPDIVKTKTVCIHICPNTNNILIS